MKKVKAGFVIVLFLMVFSFSSESFAQMQPNQGPPPIPNQEQISKMVNDLSTALNLNEEQKAKFLEMHEAHFNEMHNKEEVRKQEMEDQRKMMDAKRMKFEAELKTLLTDDQKEKFDEFMKNHQPHQNKMNNQKRK